MIRYIWDQGIALPLFASFAVAVAVAWGRRSRGVASALSAAALTCSLLVIASLTLVRDGLPDSFSVASGVAWAPGGWDRFAATMGTSEEIWLNIALYVPAGLFGVLVAWRPLVVLGLLSGLSALIETLQGIFGVGTPDFSDLVANTLGAYVGVLIATTTLLAATPRDSRRRDWIAPCVTLTVVALVGLLSVHPLARARQADVVTAARDRFHGHTMRDLRIWERDGSLGRRVFALAGTYSDGTTHTDGRTEIRFPTSYLGVRQCVYTTWTSEGVTVDGRRGTACTVFLG